LLQAFCLQEVDAKRMPPGVLARCGQEQLYTVKEKEHMHPLHRFQSIKRAKEEL